MKADGEVNLPILQHMKELPVLFGFNFCSLDISGFCVIFAPQKLALVIHLHSLVAQKYKPIVVHTDLNVSGSWEQDTYQVRFQSNTKFVKNPIYIFNFIIWL